MHALLLIFCRRFPTSRRPTKSLLVGREPTAAAAAGRPAQPCSTSQVIKALLSLLAAPPPQRGTLQDAFAAGGGVAAACYLLRMETGAAHSKLAASCTALLNAVLLDNQAARDELRRAGGVQVRCESMALAVWEICEPCQCTGKRDGAWKPLAPRQSDA